VKLGLLLFAAGLAALIVQGALALLLPPPLCPDLGLLVVLAIGLYWQSLPGGFALATLLGYAADVLSGSLMGLHAFLRLLSFATAALAGRQLNLRGPLPLAVFAGALAFVYGAAVHLITSFFGAGGELSLAAAAELVVHAIVDMLVAPLVASAVARLCAWSGEEDAPQRGFRLRSEGLR